MINLEAKTLLIILRIILSVLLKTKEMDHPFRRFMITVEDAEDENNADVGSLKIQDSKTRHSEKCFNTVENADDSDKTEVEVCIIILIRCS